MNDGDRGPVRWGLVTIGLALGVPAAYALQAFVRVRMAAPGGLSPTRTAAVALLLSVLAGLVVLGGMFAVHGLRGTTRLPPRVSYVGLGVLALAGLFLALLLGVHLVGGPGILRGAGGVVLCVELAVSSTMCFLLATVVWWQARGRPLTRFWDGVRCVCSAALPFFLLVAYVGLTTPDRQHPDRPPRPVCINNARNLALILSMLAERRGWPPYGGRNFVLSLVANRSIDIRNPDNLPIFFCPNGHEAGNAPERADYEKVTKEALAWRRFPRLTDFAGRRNDETEYALKGDESDADEPILACRWHDGVVVGFGNGRARYLDRDDLGLAPEEPIVFGAGSSSALLRKLSDR